MFQRISDSEYFTGLFNIFSTNLHEFDGRLERIIETEQQQKVLFHGQQLSKLSDVDFPVLVVVVSFEKARLQLNQHVVSQRLREIWKVFLG